MNNREQVIKALECCSNKPRPDCANCPVGEKRGCAIDLYKNALSLIKELTEENEKLIEENAEVKANWQKLKDSHESNCEECRAEFAKLTEKNERLRGKVEGLEEERKYHFAMSKERIAKDKAEMQERIRKSLPQLLIDSSYLDVLDEEQWIPAADQLFNGILEITEEMLDEI